MRIITLIRFRKISSAPPITTSYISACLAVRGVRASSQFKRPSITLLPRDNLISEFKSKVHEDKTLLSPIEWRNLREHLISNFRSINSHNIDAVIVSQCNDPRDLKIAKNYIHFLESEGIQPNYATLGKLLKIYHLAYKNGGISQADEEEILKICHTIRLKHDVFDATTCENLIHGLLATEKWKDSLELLEIIKLSASPSMSTYSSLISKAFTANEMSLGWKLLHEMVNARKQPKCEAYIAYIHSISRERRAFVENLEKLFAFLGAHEILISHAVVEELRKCLEAQNYSLSLATLNGNGKCSNCQSYMQNISISDEDFDELSSSFMQRVLIRKDVFQKSTPKEVENFVKFVDKTGPYDCVIDGLNVAFSCGAKKSPKVFVHLLTSVVKYFQRQNKHVLVLGRKHMNQWPKEEMNFIKKNASVFFTNDLSHDDPFLLYATIKSGQATDFFSRDLMRSHAFLLGTKLKSIFRRWQQEHQYSLVTATDFGKVVVKEPIRHIKYAQQVNSIWHIPYKENYSPNPAELFEVPESWLCIKLK